MKSIKFEQHSFYNPRTNKYGPRSGDQELSMSWDNTPSRNELTGFESKVNFKHVTNYDIYNKLLKSN